MAYNNMSSMNTYYPYANPNQVQFVNYEPYDALAAAAYTNGLTLETSFNLGCSQQAFNQHSSPASYYNNLHVQSHPDNNEGWSPLSPLTPLSPTSSMSPPPSDGYLSPSAGSRVSENQCTHPNCKSNGKFKRKTDLARHVRTQHQVGNKKESCKHAWCGRTGENGFSRHDHYREHLREVHREPIPYKTRRDNSKPSKRQNTSKSSVTSAPR